MAKLRFNGPLRMSAASYARLSGIAITTALRHLAGRRMAPDWDIMMETGIRYWRHQHTAFLNDPDPARGRQRFYSLITETDDTYDVTTAPSEGFPGLWVHPARRRSPATILYFHGGGYALRGHISHRFAAMLAHHTGAPVLCPHYRLTPEHPHPAQSDDAMAAWCALTATVPPERIVLIGDSAGGHMALMHLLRLRAEGRAQPALCIGLCPWVDIGDRGPSLHANDATDMVQGWMALRFGQWLDPEGRYGRKALSPLFQDFTGTAPIYLQSGGREMLCEQIQCFAAEQKAKGTPLTHDTSPDMPHDFQLYGTMHHASQEALRRIVEVVGEVVGGDEGGCGAIRY